AQPVVLIKNTDKSGQMAGRRSAWGRYLVGQIIGYENMERWDILVKLERTVIRPAKVLRVPRVGGGKSLAVRQI
ncbi:MAG: hypothetical protein QGH25_13530, partial [Candidatus Latescibacteria bacterium]|nr:hypothetical protein [Candidatus Latescibacterota bacterium]